jgi:hypothetical protein
MLGMGYLGLLMDLCLVGYLTSDSHFFAWTVVPWWMTVTFVEALSLVASLLVVRSCGYRLVRLSIDTNETVRNEAVRYLKLRTEKSQGAEAEEPRS